MKKNLLGYTLDRMVEEFVALGESKYRAKQVFSWIYKKRVLDFSLMSDVSKSFRAKLESDYCLTLPKIHTRLDSKDGTIKLLLEMEDGSKVEAVMMPYDYGCPICVSSEVGCSMGCAFCASGLLKKKRGLETSEMVGELMLINQILEERGESVTHINVMGTGEPFDNFDNVMDFIRIANNPFGLGIGARHITVSTCGLPKGIIEYGKLGIQTNLALSLHAPNDEIRNKIMPISKAYDLDTVFKALEEYYATSGRRITLEYIMLKGLNDSRENAKELAALIHKYKVLCYVNLIPYNEVKEMPFRRSEMTTCRNFVTTLMQNGINATIRKEFGGDIDAACGQLRVKVEKNRG